MGPGHSFFILPQESCLIAFEVEFKNQSSHLDSYQRKIISSDVAVNRQTPNQNHCSCSNCWQTQSSLKQAQKASTEGKDGKLEGIQIGNFII